MEKSQKRSAARRVENKPENDGARNHNVAAGGNRKRKLAKAAAANKAQEGGGGKKKRKIMDDMDGLLDLEAGVNSSFGVMDAQLLGDSVIRMVQRFGGDLSSVEVADLTVSGRFFF